MAICATAYVLLGETPENAFTPYVIGFGHVHSFIAQVSRYGAVFGFAAQIGSRTAKQ